MREEERQDLRTRASTKRCCSFEQTSRGLPRTESVWAPLVVYAAAGLSCTPNRARPSDLIHAFLSVSQRPEDTSVPVLNLCLCPFIPPVACLVGFNQNFREDTPCHGRTKRDIRCEKHRRGDVELWCDPPRDHRGNFVTSGRTGCRQVGSHMCGWNFVMNGSVVDSNSACSVRHLSGRHAWLLPVVVCT